MLLFCMAPAAPFLPLLVERARGDMSFAGALVPLVAVGTVVFMPLMAPLMIKGLTISIWLLAKPLLLTILLPLVIGTATRHYAETVATKIIPAVNLIAKLTTLMTIVWAAVLYYPEMLATVGSFALLSMLVFMVVMGWITYRFGFGLKQNQRSVMSLGMLTRNGSVVLRPFHSERGTRHHNVCCHVCFGDGCNRSHCSHITRQAGRKNHCRKCQLNAPAFLLV
jgi:BASS family bile acid:Na+ symporter